MPRLLPALALMLCMGCSAVPHTSVWNAPASVAAQELAGVERAACRLEAEFGGVESDSVAEQRMAALVADLSANVEELSADVVCRVLATDNLYGSSLPGRIYISRGLYRRMADDDVLAAFLGHELAHMARRDHYRSRCTCERESLAREEAADALALVYLQHAGFRPAALSDVIDLIEHLRPPNWAQQRRAAITAAIRSADNVIAYAD